MTSVLFSTSAGRAATVRTVRWAPIVLVPVLASAAVLVAGALAGGRGATAVEVLGDTGLVLTAAVTAFVADDVAGGPSPSAPVGLRARLAGRAAAAVPVAVAGWVLVLAAYWHAADGAMLGSVATRAFVAVAVAAGTTAVAVEASRRLRPSSPGAVALAAVVAVEGVVLRVAPASWIEALPAAPVAAAVGVTVAAAVVVRATREPAAT